MRRTLALLSVVLLGTYATPANCQDTLKVEQNRLDGSSLRDFSVVWRANRSNADGNEISNFTVEENYELVQTQGADLWKMAQVWNNPDGTPLFKTVRVADYRTMEYVAFHTGSTPGGLAHLDIDEGFVSGFYAPAPEQKVQSFSLFLDERPLAGMSGVLFATFPLEEGERFIYPNFGWGGMSNPTIRWSEIKVISRDMVALPDDQIRESWKLQSGDVLYWVSREMPYFLKAESRKADGQTTIFTIEHWSASSDEE